MNDTDIELKKQKVLDAQKELELAEQLKTNEKNTRFTNEVNQNVKNFENISHKDRGRYSQFIEKTAESFHKNNLILSVAVGKNIAK